MPLIEQGIVDVSELATEAKQDDIITELQLGVDRYYLEVAKGNVTGNRRFGIGGHNPAVNSGVEETVWEQGGRGEGQRDENV